MKIIISICSFFLIIPLRLYCQDGKDLFENNVCYVETIEEANDIDTCDIGIALGASKGDSFFLLPKEIINIKRLVHLRISSLSEIILIKDVKHLTQLKVIELSGRITNRSINSEVMKLEKLEVIELIPKEYFPKLPKRILQNRKSKSIQFNFIGIKQPYTRLFDDIKKLIKKKSFTHISVFGWNISEQAKRDLLLLSAQAKINFILQ